MAILILLRNNRHSFVYFTCNCFVVYKSSRIAFILNYSFYGGLCPQKSFAHIGTLSAYFSVREIFRRSDLFFIQYFCYSGKPATVYVHLKYALYDLRSIFINFDFTCVFVLEITHGQMNDKSQLLFFRSPALTFLEISFA